MKKKIKFISLIVISLLLLSSFSMVFAGNGSALIDELVPDYTEIQNTPAKGIAERIVGALRIAGYFTGVILIVVLGVKFILASADEKADLKYAAPKYLVGAMLVVFAVEIINAIFSM